MNILGANEFKVMLESGYANLSNNASYIDTLNVFPVPDGDTGSNMSMTFENGYKEAMKCNSDSIGEVAKALSRGLLMGARGNSGVITSQIFRGFYHTIEENEKADVAQIAEGFENGARVAYKAIMKPVEGTILTVIREASWYAKHDLDTKNPNMDLGEYFDLFVKYANESLQRTPDLLPVLKEVGVVDSGGQGLVKILEGFKAYIDGNPIRIQSDLAKVNNEAILDIENDEFGYCTEFILRLSDEYRNIFDEERLKKKLTDIGGESLVVVKDDDLVKVHVHMLKPGDALNVGQRYGDFIKLKIENMQEQHSHIIEEKKVPLPKEHKKYGLITVAAGEGLKQLFTSLGVDIVVSGGQTMNPSTQDFVKAVNELNHTDHIFIFPNNSNIVLAAKQAKDILSDKDITVIETVSIPEGISAIGILNQVGDKEENIETIKEVISNVTSASLTYAIKDTTFDNIEVKEGDYIAMANKKIVASSKNKLETIYSLLDYLFTIEDKELITIIAGDDYQKEEVDKLVDYISKNSSLESEVIRGGQPVYSYLFGVE